MLRIVRPKASRHFTPEAQKRLEKQVKDLAWLIAINRMGRPTLTFKVKGHLLKNSKKVIKHAELSGDIQYGDKRIHYVVANPYQFNYRTTVMVFKGEKNLMGLQGSLNYCFDMLTGLDQRKR